MFIRLTRTNGVPVWLNASFIVTIEPGRDGGSIVVPIGDGLDYEVRESPETVLSMIEGAPSVKVVPVPPPKSLTPRPDDVSPEECPVECDKVNNVEVAPAQRKKAGKSKASAKKEAAAKQEEQAAEAIVDDRKEVKTEATAKKKRTVSRKKAVAGDSSDSALSEEYQKIVDDLKSRKCRTVKRMRNAMKSFHGKSDSEEIDRIIETMLSIGCILIEADGHVNWIA